ncbi:histidine phosphatase family protein [Desulfatirhabdium butyrativorans]|uniref:histidine phosphatase family protein n=1 Tax=Desulfatirhabdium butyrativorans TaxID=340467 RepID=UPI00041892E0|nr:histidine phosphatase family protein [Desulfatirhabdium butyrativorans]
MKIFLARHGQTFGNSQGIVMGHRDFPLTAAGIETTRKLAHIIQDRVSDAIILSSPLARALECARIYADQTGWRIEVVAEMAELACGQWEGQPKDIVAPDHPFIRSSWTQRPPGGESYADAEARIAALVERIQRLPVSSALVLLGHGGANRVFLKLWMHLNPALALWVFQPNACVYILDEDSRVSWIDAEGNNGKGLIVAES